MIESLNDSYLNWINADNIFRGIVIYFFIIWFCLVIWVVRDITNRTNSLLFQVFSILIVLFLTPLGVFIYLLIRPQKTLFEQIFEREFMRLEEEYNSETQHSKAKGMDIEKSSEIESTK